MRMLSHVETLLFYDGPELFVGRDQLGTSYACLLVELNEETDKYLCVPVSPGRLNYLVAGDLDLREMVEHPEAGQVFEAQVENGDLSEIPIHPLPEISETWLPEPGLYVELEPPPNVEVVKEALQRGRAVIHCKLNPPEAREEPKITAGHLSQAVKLFQRVVRHAYSKALRKVDDLTRKQIASPSNCELEVLAFSPGSFTIHMQTAAPADLVGYSQVAKALEILDRVSYEIGDTDQALETVARYGGHFATALKDLLRFVIDSEAPLTYEWSMPERRSSTRRKITIVQAKPLYDALVKHVDLGFEEKRLVGVLTKVDAKYGTWRILSEDDGKEYGGRSDPSHEVGLAGLVIGTGTYEFTCEERLEEEQGTGRESTKLYLRSYRRL